jgi:hypothetical protein
MTPDAFIRLVEELTGRPPKEVGEKDKEDLAEALSDDRREIDVSQFNELLLIVNKDLVTEPFFRHFFSSETKTRPLCRIGDIPDGVQRFQKAALLGFGNFIYAYRTLSRAQSYKALLSALGGLAAKPEELLQQFKGRGTKILRIKPVKREETYLLGYLSRATVLNESKQANLLVAFLEGHPEGTWDDLRTFIEGHEVADARRALADLVTTLRPRLGTDASTRALLSALQEALKRLDPIKESLTRVLATGTSNADVYLSWDYMDVYFATSMRRRWEFESLFDFVSELMASKRLRDLKIRYFDPTQSFDDNRINKGLIESLMLKRSVCTVYSVQDTDTLGKDSELAATLAQGKPVIAYAPNIDVEKRVRELCKERPRLLYERFQFLLYQDEGFAEGGPEDARFVREFSSTITEFEKTQPWKAICDPTELETFQRGHDRDLERFCRLIASSERRLYDRRAEVLRGSHPLGMQVSLETGVANGVLVARDTETCAELLRRILLNEMEFEIVDDDETKCWLLNEKLTGSTYRVVTRNRKLTNCFWNYYRKETPSGGVCA